MKHKKIIALWLGLLVSMTVAAAPTRTVNMGSAVMEKIKLENADGDKYYPNNTLYKVCLDGSVYWVVTNAGMFSARSIVSVAPVFRDAKPLSCQPPKDN